MFLKNFKKASSDKESTTLKHTDGHELKIAHKGLSKKMREQLEALPHYDEGGDVQKSPVTINVGGQPPQQPTPSPSPSPDAPPTPAPGMPAPEPQQTPVPAPTQAEAPAEPQPQPQVAAPAPEPEPTQPDQEQPAPERELAQAKQTVQAQGITPQSPDYEKDIYAATLNNKDADYYKDLAMGHIKPQTYKDLFDAKGDTLGKIGTLFGLLVAGAGSGLTHQPNAVLHMMDQQISNDFEAQKQNRTNALSMLQRYQQHQNDVSTRALQGVEAQKFLAETAREREEAVGLGYKNKMFISALHSIETGNDKLPPGPQKTNAQQSAAAVQQGVIQKVSENNAKAGQMLADAEMRWKKKNQMLNLAMPEQAKYQTERHIPGVGDSSVPLSSQDREKVLGLNNFQNLLNEAIDLNDRLGKRGAWTPTEKARAAQVHNDLVSSYNDVKGLNRFTGNEEALYDKIIPDVGRVNLTGSARATLGDLGKSIQNKKNLVYGELGITPSPTATATATPSAAPSGQVSKSGKPMRQDPKTGKWFYIKLK